MEDNQTVNPDTYELTRFGDWVMEPSQNVFATLENTIESKKITESKEDVKKETADSADDEIISEKDKSLDEGLTNKNSNKYNNEKMSSIQLEEIIMEKFHGSIKFEIHHLFTGKYLIKGNDLNQKKQGGR